MRWDFQTFYSPLYTYSDSKLTIHADHVPSTGLIQVGNKTSYNSRSEMASVEWFCNVGGAKFNNLKMCCEPQFRQRLINRPSKLTMRFLSEDGSAGFRRPLNRLLPMRLSVMTPENSLCFKRTIILFGLPDHWDDGLNERVSFDEEGHEVSTQDGLLKQRIILRKLLILRNQHYKILFIRVYIYIE